MNKAPPPVLKYGAPVALVLGGLAVALYGRIDHDSEAFLLSIAGTPLEAEHVPDARPDKSWRAELFQLGLEHVTSARLDLDRDGRIDQSWEYFSDGRIRRSISSDDTGVADRYEERVDGEWIETDAPAESVDAEALLDLDEALAAAGAAREDTNRNERTAESDGDDDRRAAELFLLMQQGRELQSPTLLDGEPSASWRVTLFQGPNDESVSGAHLDLGRDGTIEQRWRYGPGEQLARERIAEGRTVQERWTPEGWQDAPSDAP
ncbi:MAG: hypothetical protein AAF411_31290 [Myxococcota bacterium]